MGSGSSVEYFQYMQQQAMAGDSGAPGSNNNNNGNAFHNTGLSQSGRPGTPQTRPGTGYGGGGVGGGGDSAAAMLRQHLLNAGQLLWKSAPDMLQRMETLERQNAALSQEVDELRGLLEKDDLFPTLQQARAEINHLKQRLAEVKNDAAAQNMNGNSAFASSPRFGGTGNPGFRNGNPMMSPTPQQRGAYRNPHDISSPSTFMQQPRDMETPQDHRGNGRETMVMTSFNDDDSPYRSALPTTETQAKPAPVPNPFSIGQKIEADFHGKGRYYGGTIKFVHKDGTVDVTYDDGDEEPDVPLARVRAVDENKQVSNSHQREPAPAPGPAPAPAAATGGNEALQEGDRVEVNYKDSGNFFPGKIAGVKEMSPGAYLYDIAYDDGDSEDFVPRERIKLLQAFGRAGISNKLSASPQQASKFQVGDEVEGNYQGKGKYYVGQISAVHDDSTYDIDYDDGSREERLAEDKLRAIDFSPLVVGTKVEANYRASGNYFPGKVSAVQPDGTYDILYDDNDSEEGVKRSYLRVSGATAPAAKAAPAASSNAQGLTDDQRDRLLQIFRWSDHDRDSYLNEHEFQMWCDKTGLSDLFDQFEKLCDMLSCNSALGITAGALMELYQMEFQTEIEAHHAKVLRDIDLSGQFRIADKDGDGRLNAAEAQTLSDLRGIPFLKEEDYLLLCKELKSDNGLTQMQFESLIGNFQNLEAKADDDDMFGNADVVRSVIRNH